MEENKEEIAEKALKSTFQYTIVVGEDVNIHYEDSNENRFASFILVQRSYDELWDMQMEAGRPEDKMNKAELKELQIARTFLKKHIALLGAHIKNKYKDAIYTAEKPKIQVFNPLVDAKDIPKDLRAGGK